MTLSEALRTPHWYLLWSILALNVTAGSALISVAVPLTQELTHVGPALGAMVVCLISLFNGLGRAVLGSDVRPYRPVAHLHGDVPAAGDRLRVAAGDGPVLAAARSGRGDRAVLRRRVRHHAGVRHRRVRPQKCRNDLRRDAHRLERGLDRRPDADRIRSVYRPRCRSSSACSRSPTSCRSCSTAWRSAGRCAAPSRSAASAPRCAGAWRAAAPPSRWACGLARRAPGWVHASPPDGLRRDGWATIRAQPNRREGSNHA